MADIRTCITLGAAVVFGASSIALAQGSDDPFNPQSISVPGSDSGNTCTGADNFDAVCPYTGSTSPDKWYSFTGVSGSALLEICGSLYDTKLYVLDAGFNIIGCNDDSCGSDGFKSQVLMNGLNAGDTYTVAIDGWGGDCGTFTLNISLVAGCDINCTNDENEACGSDTNGGCNAGGIFGSLAGGTVCGTAWADAGTRDTDWFELNHGGGDLTWAVDAEFPVVAFILNSNCAALAIQGTPGDSGGICGMATASFLNAPAALYYLFTATGGAGGSGIFEGYPCGGDNNYSGTVQSTLPCPYDLDGDGNVGFGDALLILSNWGPCP